MVALYTARICEFFGECLCSGLWSGSFSVFSSFSAWFGAAVLQRAFSCILFISTFQGVRVIMFFQDANHKQQFVYDVFSCYRIFGSRSGSTVAPPVNTLASPPSQSVSLPDNNSLAQAISRALAESLLLLLSFPRDSSGGNTNMPATFGPLSLASKSMPSLASSRSGTPCSTMHSSGTLAVPSFISTYSSFGGPAVVSTLPAMSSANLPVVWVGLLWWHDWI